MGFRELIQNLSKTRHNYKSFDIFQNIVTTQKLTSENNLIYI